MVPDLVALDVPWLVATDMRTIERLCATEVRAFGYPVDLTP